MSRLKHRLHRRFLRDPANGYLGGVCEGAANGLGVPPTGVRIAVLVTGVLFTTLTVIAYGAAWLLMDSRDEVLHS